jgi:hypothetical protein
MAFPATYNFNYYRGDTFEFIIFPKNSNGTTFDLTNYNSNLFTIATARGPLGEEVALGTVVSSSSSLLCKISASAGSLLSDSSYVYDVQINDTAASVKYTLITGAIAVTQDVTDRVS